MDVRVSVWRVVAVALFAVGVSGCRSGSTPQAVPVPPKLSQQMCAMWL